MEVSSMAGKAQGVGKGGVTGEKTLKKKKSLKQLFIPSRSKTTNSRSVSAPGVPQSPAHTLDDKPPLPQSARALPSTPAKTFSVMFNERKSSKEVDQNIWNAVDTIWGSNQNARPAEPAKSPTSTTHRLSNSSIESQIFSPEAKLSVPSSQSSLRSPTFLLDQKAPDVPPKSQYRSTTDTTIKPIEKPRQYVPQSTGKYDPVSSIPTASYGHQPQSPSYYRPPRVSSARYASSENFKDIEAPLPEQCQRVPWSPIQDLRESTQSGFSTGSSYLDSATTKHSSVFTKNSTVTYPTIDAEYEDEPKCSDEPKRSDESKRSLTVEDVIDMYLAGWEEDEPADVGDVKASDKEVDLRKRSDQIAEAVEEPIDTMLSPPKSLDVDPPARASSTAIVSGKALQSWFHHPPRLREPTATHDQYGFRKESRDVSVEDYDSWHSGYLPNQERRIGKWINYMQSRGLPTKDPTKFPPRSDKTQTFVRKGIPPAWRGEAWFFYAGGNELLLKRPDYYSELIVKCQTPALLSSDKEAIERDLHRSFPDNIHFKPEHANSSSDDKAGPPPETPIVSALRRLLQAFSVHYPGVGYCQSLNFLGGILLVFLPEEKAFWMLHIITTRLLPGTHEKNLEGVDIDTWAMLLALKDQSPAIWAKIGGDLDSNTEHLPTISACSTSWFMNAFLGTLPTETVLRVWDVMFYDGVKTLFRIALAILKCGEDTIKKIQDPLDILQYIQNLPRQMLNVASLFEVAFSRGELGHKFIDMKRQERKEYHIKKRAAEEAAKKEAMFADGEDADAWPQVDISRPAMLDDEPASPLQRAPTRSRYKRLFSRSNTKLDAQ